MRVYEWPSLVGLVFSLPLFFVVDRRKKILVLVAFGTWLAYSLIPYKTPWLIVNFIWPFALVFGFALESLSRLKSKRLVYGARILALALVGVSLEKTIQLNFKEFANPKEPYVYVQSTEQMKRVIDQINERVVKRPEDLNMRLMVLVKDTWPLPWVFSLFPNLSFGTPENIELTGAHVILIDGSKRPNLEGRLRGRFFREPFQIRDSYENGYAYLDFDKLKEIVPAGTEIFEGSTK
jgi:hypothetical protein